MELVAVVECPLPVASNSDNLRVVLVATRNPLNLGAAARAMSNFGFLRLRVVNPYEVAFREARSAVGASTVLKNAQEYSTIAEAVADCGLVVGTTTLHKRQRQHPLYRLEYAARRIRKSLSAQRVALLFGSEKVGLSNQDLSHCHWLMHVPTREQHPSMNLGQAVAVCLYEMVRATSSEMRAIPTETIARSSQLDARSRSKAASGSSATSGELERITRILLETLRTSGYLGEAPSLSAEAKIRRLVRRLKLQADDVELLLGMLRQILWKVRTTH